MYTSNRKPSLLAMTILGLGFLLGSGQVGAETLYHISPKIAPRTREAAPVLSPFVAPAVTSPKPTLSSPSTEEAAKGQTVPRIEVEPNYEIPVSYTQPQASKTEAPASKPLSTPQPKNSIKTTQKKPQSHSNHPVVQPPEPLLPDSPQSALPDPADRLLSNEAHAVIEMTTVTTLETVDLRAVADDRLIAQAAATDKHSTHSHEKPAVQFPEDLEPSAPTQPGASAKPSDRNIYPVNYQPYIGRITEQRQQDLEAAISHYNRAAYYEQRNKLDEAVSEYKQALLLHSMFADAYVGMSTAFIRKNDWENVMESLQKALAMKQRFMDPSNIVQAWYNLSTAHCVADNYSPARRYYQKVKLAGHPNQQQLWEFIQKNCTP